MTISTKDCKNFIISIADVINIDLKDNWKIIKKYKEHSLNLRDFENQDGRVLTIAETSGKLFLYYLSPMQYCVQQINQPGTKLIGHPVNAKEVCSFMAESIEYDEDALGTIWEEDIEKTLQDAKNPSSWHIWETYSHENDTLNDFFDDTDMFGTKFLLLYAEGNATVKVQQSDILNVFIVIMGQYSTNYRFTIFETKNHTLLLGHNDSD